MIGDLVTQDGHIQYGDLLLGEGGAAGWTQLAGWLDMPGLDSGTTPRPVEHGAWPGRLYAQPRTITVEGVIVREPLGANVAAIRAGTPVAQDEQPLVVRLDGQTLYAEARCTRRALPITPTHRVGRVYAALQWEASDPRLYDPTEVAAGTGLPSAPVGLTYNLTYPLSYGSGGASGAVAVTNGGNADSHPIVVFAGECDTPSVTVVSTGMVLEFDIALTVADTLVVDCRAGTATLNGVASRLMTRTSRSALLRQFTVPPGAQEIAFRALSGTATMTVSRYAAWM
ncbi:hypothetical protein B4N89_20525 [Embleya scabrispora]|uniref:Siphovirus-type tail component C-terminal domain-containing protein n=1 Tax=Embleya scabrispora TaxID=159449 RepID=A0A1T3P230_9ACTN|nr:phage tail domain-containing protein [Embleya scabrispora]OPC83001.1 hypothetical protein B4N89_20525 [Embleya scabrispora]